jgi:uncharacterized protein (DUF1778 family)
MQIVSMPGNSARYPDRISAPAPRDLRGQIRRAAEIRQIGTAEFIRQAVSREGEATLEIANKEKLS